MEQQDLGKTSTGIKPNVAGLLCYLVGFITGIIFLLIETENKFVRFHAMQSIVVFGALFVIGVVAGFVVPLLGAVVLAGEIALWIVLMIKAYQGEKFRLPVAGEIAEQSA